jgi:hypothetical protein
VHTILDIKMKKYMSITNISCLQTPKLLEYFSTKLQWLQDPSEINGDNLNNVSEASRHFGNKKGKYLKDKIIELAINSKNKNFRDLYRGINEFKRGYQPRRNLVKDENGDLLADSRTILNRWKSYFSQSLSDVMQIEIQLKEYKSPGSDQIPVELIQAAGETLVFMVHKLMNSIWNKEELPDQWKESIIVPMHRKEDKVDSG